MKDFMERTVAGAKALALAAAIGAVWNAILMGMTGSSIPGAPAPWITGLVAGPVVVLFMETVGRHIALLLVRHGGTVGGLIALPLAIVRIACCFVPVLVTNLIIKHQNTSAAPDLM